jgi:hypothetical protein
LVLLFQQNGSNQSYHRIAIGENPDDIGTAPNFAIQPLQRIRRVDPLPMHFRKRHLRQHIFFRFLQDLHRFRKTSGQFVHYMLKLAFGLLIRRLGENGPE